MIEFRTPAWLKEWVVTQVKHSSNYTGLGMSTGGICALIARLNGVEPWSWFFIGFTISPGLAAFVYSMDFMVERRLRKLKRWRESDEITQELYEIHMKAEMDWRASRLYGSAAKPAPRPRRKPRSKSIEIPTSPNKEEPTQAPAGPGTP